VFNKDQAQDPFTIMHPLLINSTDINMALWKMPMFKENSFFRMVLEVVGVWLVFVSTEDINTVNSSWTVKKIYWQESNRHKN
jgi:hypothetical protein